jgi:predicted dehydrogenase
VLGSRPERGEKAAAANLVPRAYRDLDELLADKKVDVVHITSPNQHHFEQARRAIAAGKHVLCEKPLAMTSKETAELAALAARSSVVAAVCYNVRFNPLCLEARERCRGLGPVHHVTGSYLQDWLLKDTDFNWRVQAEAGGDLRAVADIGTHWMDLVSFITGLSIEAVCADLATIHPVRQAPVGGVETFQRGGPKRETVPVSITTEDYGSILFRCRSGARGAFTVSQVTAGRKNCVRFDIACQEASLAWDSEEPNTLFIGHRDRANESLTRDPSLLSDAARPFANYPGGHAEGFPDSFKQLFRAVYSAIETGKPGAVPYPTFADGHQEVALCEAILRSHRDQRWVSVG